MLDPATVASLIATLYTTGSKGLKVVRRMRSKRQGVLDLLSESEQMRKYLEQLKGLSDALKRDAKFRNILSNFNDARCKSAVDAVQKFVEGLSARRTITEWYKSAVWASSQGRVESLLKDMRNRKNNLTDVLTMVIGHTTPVILKMQSTQDDMFRNIRDMSNKLKIFMAQKVVVEPIAMQSDTSAIIWWGDVLVDKCPKAQLELRKKICWNGAWNGNFEQVFAALEQGKALYQQNWVNCTKLRPLTQKDLKFYHMTPLHQAAMRGADATVVQKLVKLGASRTMTTARTDPIMIKDGIVTALEIAQANQFTALYPILSPVIRQGTPYEVLQALEKQLHNLIRDELGDAKTATEMIKLPQLQLLLELERPEMHMHVDFKKAYEYRLDGRQLYVRSFIKGSKDKQATWWVIRESAREQIEQPYVFKVVKL